MKTLVFILALLLISVISFAQTTPEQADKLATSLGIVYVDMPKESLYQVFSDLQQRNYRTYGNDEWITFSDWTTEEPGDLITFHLVDGKVKGWEKPKRNKSMESEAL